MDQLKTYLAVLQKRHFWVLCAVLVIVAPLSCRFGTSYFDAEYSTRKSSLDGTFRNVGGIASERPHPNETFIEGVKKEHAKLNDQVLAAWELFYENQQSILQWPEQFARIGQQVAAHDPRSGQPLEIHRDARSNYMNYADKEFPKLFDIVEIRRSVDGTDDKTERYVGKVVWPGSQAIVDRVRWNETPSTQAVLFAQEDYWVYQALCEIIKAMNQDADGHYNAPIKRIDALEIAQAVTRPDDGGIERLSATSDRKAETPKVPTPSSSDEELANGRYVDAEGNPISGGAAPSGEFRRMPIHMKLTMDQRQIPRLLTECANSPLLVEVTRVKFRASESRGQAQKGGGGGEVDIGPFDVTVDVWGVVYIYNRPDRARFETQQVAAN